MSLQETIVENSLSRRESDVRRCFFQSFLAVALGPKDDHVRVELYPGQKPAPVAEPFGWRLRLYLKHHPSMVLLVCVIVK